MRRFISTFTAAGLFVGTGLAAAQTASRPSFEVASIKPAAPLDMQKLAQQMMAGGEMPKIGPHVDGAQAEYTYMALKELIVIAYKVKPYQISGPDWIANTRFDIKAKMPEGSTKDDARLMLQSLLEDRFKLVVRRETKERPILALVVGKGGPKMKESEPAKPIDENAPLGPGESKMEGPDGPIRMKVDPKAGGAVVDMGAKGKYTYSVDRTTMAFHLQASHVTMEGLCDMLTQFSQMGGAGGRNIVDETGLKGSYDVGIDFALADLLNMARAAGMDVPAGAGGAASAAGGGEATTPGGGTSITDAVQALGLRLEPKKGPVEQLIIDHVEKTPIEN
ncbi:MAG TPA: TIGR03435 family protein [Bryobacteraceae bacterium]|nr:TIGR03435 family protein [Bryobacteraceae bacterium]